ncbi:MAG TPA: hypothetical protein VL282_05380 [Tepidisphaeraceae bacterium]|jgi:hypothetical protein|nr:hypothetical protein [Tepidisphaeraceae bacterium]
MSRTTFAIFSSPAHAEAAAGELRRVDLRDATIQVIGADRTDSRGAISSESGLADTFARAAQRGCAIVAVSADEAVLDRVMEAINHHNPLEVEQHMTPSPKEIDLNQKLPLGHMQQKIDEETAREDDMTELGRKVWPT